MPGQISFLGACVADKDAKKRKCRYEIENEEIEESEIDGKSHSLE